MGDREIERRARAICQALGMDPDEAVCHGYGDTMTAAELSREGTSYEPDIALEATRGA